MFSNSQRCRCGEGAHLSWTTDTMPALHCGAVCHPIQNSGCDCIMHSSQPLQCTVINTVSLWVRCRWLRNYFFHQAVRKLNFLPALTQLSPAFATCVHSSLSSLCLFQLIFIHLTLYIPWYNSFFFYYCSSICNKTVPSVCLEWNGTATTLSILSNRWSSQIRGF